MSPRCIAALRAIERETRSLVATTQRLGRENGWPLDTARYPRDYYRPLELARRPWSR